MFYVLIKSLVHRSVDNKPNKLLSSFPSYMFLNLIQCVPTNKNANRFPLTFLDTLQILIKFSFTGSSSLVYEILNILYVCPSVSSD